ncbi:Transmembrane amino acid transporter protein [Tritrichomonas foetus]|uniref:Transmembrane amino acid transporter protein n=1 Tax=Tritrichomonas foetus TaxID=1144522 RepID=A0A1J4K8S0_9EUKA|nr:Transmembrane amino acid transporter protein [Tritrichomonas foetus]|eukprot:OHT07897.1 Transmembrane amino acid transporter protein [Tritrichomonas foetus]
MRGGDMLVADHRFKIHGHTKNRLFFYQTSKKDMISFFSSVMILLHASIATDHLRLGQYFSIGILQTILIMLVPFLFSQLSFFYFFRSWVFGSKFTYQGVWSFVFGPTFKAFPHFLVIYSFLNHTFSLISLIPNLWSKVLTDVWSDVPSILVNEWFILYIIGFFTMLPFLFVRKVTSLTYASYAGNFCCAITIICILVDFFYHFRNIDFSHIKLFGGSYSDSMSVLYKLNQAFFIHPLLQLVTEDMENPTNKRIHNLTWTVNSLKFAIFGGCGILTYIQYYAKYGGFYKGDFMSAYSPRSGITIIIEIVTYVNVILTLSFYEFVLANFFIDLFVVNKQTGPLTIWSGVSIFLLNCTIHFTSENVNHILSIIGTVCTCLLVYILPPIFSLVLYKTKDLTWFICGILLLVVSIPLSIMMIANECQTLT